MILAGVLGRLAALVAVDSTALGAGVLVLALAAVAILVAGAVLRTSRALPVVASSLASARVRVLLRAADPNAEGHRRARAPGAAA